MSLRSSFCLVLVAVVFVGCNNPPPAQPMRDSGTTVPDTGVTRCVAADDPDGDTISSMDEGTADPDGDGRPNSMDTDSDGDGFSDASEAGDAACITPPVDTDGDMVPDYLDLDANGDGLDDATQTRDTDGDGIPDHRDPDVDGDSIANGLELSADGARVDTDGDGTPDVLDLDSDGDSIKDQEEGRLDQDGDRIPNFRDLDADGDDYADTIEAGDTDLETVPVGCPNEIDQHAEGRPVGSDGIPDYLDIDSDNDGLADRQEKIVGTNPCRINTDGDAFDDLAEGTYVLVNCPDGRNGRFCNTAIEAGVTIPATHYFLVLPFNGEPQIRDLDFSTTIRVADVFFVSDTTGSMGGTIENVKRSIATPITGLIDRIQAAIPDVWFGAGNHDDFPFGGYGGPPIDQPFDLAMRMTSGDRASEIQAGVNGIVLGGGGDGPESQTEALYQIITGEGGTWMSGSSFGGASMFTMPAYGSLCLDGGWGAPCFRDPALPIIIHFTDICSHNGPADEATDCSDYTGIDPEPHTFDQAIQVMVRRGAKYIGVNASPGTTCVGAVGPGSPSSSAPCHFLRSVAEATGSVDLDMNPLVYDLPNSASTTVFADTIVRAVETVATRVPLDVDTALRDDGADPEGVDARNFIQERVPACRATPARARCWVAPTGVPHEQAVARTDLSTFFGVVPGATVTFTITFQNRFYPGTTTTTIFVAYIDVRGGGTAVLDTRQVYIVVPATDVPIG